MEEISNFSPNVHFQKDSNMFSIIIFTLVLLGYTNACLEGKCRCHEELRVIDCTSVGLRSMPHGLGGKYGVRSAECGKRGVWKMRSVENAEYSPKIMYCLGSQFFSSIKRSPLILGGRPLKRGLPKCSINVVKMEL